MDSYSEISRYKVATEVKCPSLTFVRNNSTGPITALSFIGRIHDYEIEFERTRNGMKNAIAAVKAPRHDNKLKDYLVAANNKFRNPSEPGDVNILFIALDDYFSMIDWNGYLFANQGFFAPNPYMAASEYARVDVVILSNLQSCHMIGREFHDWTLKDVFMIPVFTTRPRPDFDKLAVEAALSLFPHRLNEFNAFPDNDDPAPVVRGYWQFKKIVT